MRPNPWIKHGTETDAPPSQRRTVSRSRACPSTYRRSRFDGTNQKGTVTTGKDGMATIDYPASFKTGYFEITAKQAKARAHLPAVGRQASPRWIYLPRRSCDSSRERRSVALSRTSPGIPSRAPRLSLRATDRVRRYECASRWARLKTDAQGRWHMDVVPSETLAVSRCTVNHPRYRQDWRPRVSRPRQCHRSQEGADGDRAGRRRRRPAGQRGQGLIGHDTFDPFAPTGTTNERGEFTARKLRPRPDRSSRSRPKGSHLRSRDIRVDEQTAPVEIQLTEPGSVVRGKVVDVEGKPVAGAFFAADTWRGHRSLRLPCQDR